MLRAATSAACVVSSRAASVSRPRCRDRPRRSPLTRRARRRRPKLALITKRMETNPRRRRSSSSFFPQGGGRTALRAQILGARTYRNHADRHTDYRHQDMRQSRSGAPANGITASDRQKLARETECDVRKRLTNEGRTGNAMLLKNTRRTGRPTPRDQVAARTRSRGSACYGVSDLVAALDLFLLISPPVLLPGAGNLEPQRCCCGRVVAPFVTGDRRRGRVDRREYGRQP